MNKLDSDENPITHILEQLRCKTSHWPEEEEPFSEKIMFQRFGLQLREADFEQTADHYRDFLIRKRNADKINNSGFSEVSYEGNEFTFQLDVWPFKIDEIKVMEKPGKYIVITAEHKERSEDDSQCSRRFQRYYRIPEKSKIGKGWYGNGILKIPVFRNEVVDDDLKLRIVPIFPLTSRENGSIPSEGKQSPAATTMNIRKVSLAVSDSDNNEEPDAGSTKSPKGELEPSEDSKRCNDEVVKSGAKDSKSDKKIVKDTGSVVQFVIM